MAGGLTLTLFRARNIPVGAHWSLFLALAGMAFLHGNRIPGAAWWAYLSGFLLAVLAFLSVLLHEFGHAIVAQRRQVPIVGIDLHLLGGVAKMGAPPRSPKDEVAIAIAGPLVSIALGVLFGAWAFAGDRDLVWAPAFAKWLAGLNLGIGIFNLLPALPMDGGRVARAFLAAKFGLVKGTKSAVWIARVLAVGIVVLGLFTNPWLIAIAVLILWMGREELASVSEHAALHQWGYRDDAIDPWARYHRAADRSRGIREKGPRLDEAPEILRRRSGVAHGDVANGDVANGDLANGDQAVKDLTQRPHTQRFVKDGEGRWTVVSEPIS